MKLLRLILPIQESLPRLEADMGEAWRFPSEPVS